jgi:hypothetical protein
MPVSGDNFKTSIMFEIAMSFFNEN